MTTDDQIRDEKLRYDINKEVAKVSTLSSGKIDKYEFLVGEKFYLLTKVEQQNKLHLLQEKLLKNK